MLSSFVATRTFPASAPSSSAPSYETRTFRSSPRRPKSTTLTPFLSFFPSFMSSGPAAGGPGGDWGNPSGGAPGPLRTQPGILFPGHSAFWASRWESSALRTVLLWPVMDPPGSRFSCPFLCVEVALLTRRFRVTISKVRWCPFIP